MFDVDWLGEGDPPKKKRVRRTKKEMVIARAIEQETKKRAKYFPPAAGMGKARGRSGGKRSQAGRRKGDGANKKESSAKAGNSIRNSVWRRHAPNTGSPDMSSLGQADCTVYNGDGRVYPKHIREDWE